MHFILLCDSWSFHLAFSLTSSQMNCYSKPRYEKINKYISFRTVEIRGRNTASNLSTYSRSFQEYILKTEVFSISVGFCSPMHDRFVISLILGHPKILIICSQFVL